MDQSVSHVLQVEIFAARAQITLIIPVTLQVTVNCCHQSVRADVKLPVLIQKRLFYVLLDNVGSLLSIEVCVRYNFFDLRKFSTHLDATPSIRVFARLDYPNLLAQFLKRSLCFSRIIIFEKFSESEILLVTRPLLNMEC